MVTMKRTVYIGVLMLILGAAGARTAYSQAGHKQHPSPSFFTGRQYLDFEERAQLMYVAGLTDGLKVGMWLVNGKTQPLEDCVAEMTVGQITAIVTQFIEHHPEHWRFDAGGIMLMALAEKCP